MFRMFRRLRFRLPRHKSRRYQSGALWSLVVLACLAAVPGLVPGGPSAVQAELFGPNGLSQQEESRARYEAWLRGQEAAREAEDQRAAAEAAAKGPGASASTPPVTLPADTDAAIPALALRAYRQAESYAAGFDPGCRLSWSVLAGIGRIESDHGRHLGAAAQFTSTGEVTPPILGPVLNGAQPGTAAIRDTDGGQWDGDVTWDRAVGPMQFIPSTWRSLGRDGNGDGLANPSNYFDATVSAAAYLCLSGGGSLADQANLRRAIFAYNHSQDYVAAVITWANFYLRHAGGGTLVELPTPGAGAAPPLAAGGGGPGAGGPGAGVGPGAGGAGSGGAGGPGGAAGPGSSARPGSSTRPGSPSRPPSTAAPTTTRPGSTVPPTTTTRPPTSSSTTSTSTTQPPTTEPPTTTTTEPCPTTTTSTSSTTTTTTTTTSSTTTTTTLPCQAQEEEPGGEPGQG